MSPVVPSTPSDGSGKRTVALVGATGSIGTQTLDVVERWPDRFEVVALACGRSSDVIEQARRFGVSLVGVADRDAAREIREALPGVEVVDGPDAAAVVAGCGADVVVNGMVGSIGLSPTMAALRAGSRLALANKESLIVGGQLVHDAAAPDQVVPVDSEHSAIAQCLRGGRAEEVARLVVTASGGPFRGRTRDQLKTVTVDDALSHPTWDMGAVITINSATLANKGLEVIEAHLLFDIDYDRIDVVVHPQSIVHSMVEFVDGATVAKLSPPDMRLPIQLALTWPERLAFAPTTMDWTIAQDLTFEPLDDDTFPMVRLAVQAGRAGGTAPAAFNAANEVAVETFLQRGLDFLGITEVVAATLESHDVQTAESVEQVLAAEADARRTAAELIRRR
ncbi:1-deoxy-D-xylulose-5-phosphate reductoisomerase [Euzebya pacifica]|uniref:1-deoxy-D-xylulose-5-phosphate reductoisomerase n=1 Tax=Euzebya pacifica TaxID=1608957 RepID=UPI0030F4EE64